MPKKFCQSCGMPLELRKEDVRGTEADKSKSEKFCSYCYEDGAFLQPDITFDQMIARGRKSLKESDGNVIMRTLMSVMYPMQLKGLERWKK